MKPRLLIRQHRRIERQLLALRAEPHRGDRVRARLVQDLSIHLAAELDVLYPAIHRAAGIVSPDFLLLERAREVLGVIAEGTNAGARYREGVEELAALFEQHVHMQETEVFPACAQRVDPATFRQIMEDVAVVSVRFAFTGGSLRTGGSLERRIS